MNGCAWLADKSTSDLFCSGHFCWNTGTIWLDQPLRSSACLGPAGYNHSGHRSTRSDHYQCAPITKMARKHRTKPRCGCNGKCRTQHCRGYRPANPSPPRAPHHCIRHRTLRTTTKACQFCPRPPLQDMFSPQHHLAPWPQRMLCYSENTKLLVSPALLGLMVALGSDGPAICKKRQPHKGGRAWRGPKGTVGAGAT